MAGLRGKGNNRKAERPAKDKRRSKRKDNAAAYADEYYAAEKAREIDLASLKKSKRYLFLGIGMLVLSIILVVGFIVLFNTSVKGKQERCWKYQQDIEAVANQYMVTNGFSSLPAYVEDLKVYDQIKQECPSGGEYTWNPVTGEYSCSEHGHYPEGFNSAHSITIDVKKTEDNSNNNNSK